MFGFLSKYEMPHSAAFEHVLLCLPKDQFRGYYSIKMVTVTIVSSFSKKKMEIAFCFMVKLDGDCQYLE